MESNVYSKTLTLLYDDPNIFDVLEKALVFEEENRGNQYYLGFEWYEVGASPQTLNMLVMRSVLKISYKSNKSTMYSFVDRDAVKKALEDFSLGKTPAEAAGIGVGSGKHAWLQLMIRSAAHKLVEGRGCLP
jgi:hypothetical protein